jgi:hypothetical protein
MLPSHIVPSPDDSFCQHKTTDDFIIGGHIEVYLARLTIRTRCVLENEVRHTVSCICEAWCGARGRIILVWQTPRSYNAAWRTAVEAWRMPAAREHVENSLLPFCYPTR